MCWGGVDPWNTVTLVDTNDVAHSFSGAQLPNFTSCRMETNDVHPGSLFRPSQGKPWTRVSFSSCDPFGVFKPAFEFDHTEWVVALLRLLLADDWLFAVSPQALSLRLLGTGTAGVARQRGRRPQ